MKSARDLQDQFGIDGVVEIHDLADDYPVVEINNGHAKATIALHGGHVMRFQPHGQEPVLWLSGTAIFQEGKAIRGGIPICWPWFGNHPTNLDLPAHGFVRTRFWTLKSVTQEDSGATCIELSISDDETTRGIWPHAFELTLTVRVAETLDVSLQMTNRSADVCSYTSALHTYLQVGDISTLQIDGLDGVNYIDSLAGDKNVTQSGPILFDAELDRIYTDTTTDIIVRDTQLDRAIRTKKIGSRSAVIWNPWIEKSEGMVDFKNGGYQHMVCIETTNAANDVIHLASGHTHSLGTLILTEK